VKRRASPGQGKNPKAAKYQRDYHVRSRRITAAARENPATRCWRCGLTLAEARAKWGSHVVWHAGHVELNGRTLRPEHSRCNIAERNARMRGKPRKRKAAAGTSKRRSPATTITW
jgi:hypothetical protein